MADLRVFPEDRVRTEGNRPPLMNEAVARRTATIVPPRDGTEGLAVRMVVRPHGIDFASGARVLPGGHMFEIPGRPDAIEWGVAVDLWR